MEKENPNAKQNLNNKFLKEILGLDKDESEKSASLLKNVVSADVLMRFNCFIEFISQDEQFLIQFKKHMKSKK